MVNLFRLEIGIIAFETSLLKEILRYLQENDIDDLVLNNLENIKTNERKKMRQNGKMLVTARDHKKATTNPFSPLEGSVAVPGLSEEPRELGRGQDLHPGDKPGKPALHSTGLRLGCRRGHRVELLTHCFPLAVLSAIPVTSPSNCGLGR